MAAPLLAAVSLAALTSAAAEDTPMAAFKLISPAFKDGAAMDRRYTCQGGDHSPPLAWSGAPAGTKSYALIVDDPDAPDPAAPKMTWVHWVLYDIPVGVSMLAEDATRALPAGTRAGVTDFGNATYGGPCPPIGRHRYFHKLYALDAVLPDLKNPTKADLEAAMKGHVLAETRIIGTYQKG
jgi:Raf kinase inhibitor-like YbhB/YbcL family protein